MKSRRIKIGNISIGGGEKIAVQSMLNAPSSDAEANERQALELEAAGCDIIRIAVPNAAAVATLKRVKAVCRIPVVADIHFDYRLAIASAEAGADKIRINPGNLGGEDRLAAVAAACRSAGIPIRVGVNSGSLEAGLLEKYSGPTAGALAESALNQVRALEKLGFEDIVVSAKSSSPKVTVDVNRILSDSCDYPLHIGVTEAGTERGSLLKSAAGIGSLLMDSIGDTIRISITGDPVREAEAGRDLLLALGLAEGASVISCPTCGRTRGPVKETADLIAGYCRKIRKPLKVAVMGCEVNGPGEASCADIGIAFCADGALMFRGGKRIKKGSREEIVSELIEYLKENAYGA